MQVYICMKLQGLTVVQVCIKFKDCIVEMLGHIVQSVAHLTQDTYFCFSFC